MWWLDPGKELLNIIFNRILAPYVENLDLNQVNYGIGQGRITLKNLKLKKGALDKFEFPIDVLEGHLGTFTLSLYWMNLGNQPVEIFIEDVYILAVPSSQNVVDPIEEAERTQSVKLERLENAELLQVKEQMTTPDTPKSQGLLESLVTKIVNNVQVTIKNIHIRYEDGISVPGHPFATGITLSSFSAISVNDEWQPAFIESTSGTIHKLARLQSLAVYFDTDAKSVAGLPREKAISIFTSMISQGEDNSNHQFILKPVSGDGQITINHVVNDETPRLDVHLLFDEISVAFDDRQYRDVISLVDMYHIYLRQHQYRKFRFILEDSRTPIARSRFIFAAKAILAEVQERRRRWTWAHFTERRDNRKAYVSLYQKRLSNQITPAELSDLDALERKLSYDDLRFYRSIARSQLKKDLARKAAGALPPQTSKQGWLSWAWGGANEQAMLDPTFQVPMTEEQRKQLYDILDYDEKSALVDSLQISRTSLKSRFSARLKKGTFAIKKNVSGQMLDIISVVFDVLVANFVQRPGNFEASLSLRDLGVFDGMTSQSLHPKIVHVKDAIEVKQGLPTDDFTMDHSDAFFFLKFESNPLDDRSDTALTLIMRHMEIIYHRGYVEAIYDFFKPPASQLESVEALLNVATQTIEDFRKETRAGLEYALQTHKTIDVQMDLNAPVIIIPEDVRTYDCRHLILDAGHISIESNLVGKEAVDAIHSKRNKQYNEEDYRQLESLMYDQFSLRLDAAQFIIGDNYQICKSALSSTSTTGFHLLERTSFDLQLQNSIVPTAYNLPRVKVSANLPSLQLNFSDSKYKSLMRLIDVAIPRLTTPAIPEYRSPPADFALKPSLFGLTELGYVLDDVDSDVTEEAPDSGDEFFEAEDGSSERPEIKQHTFELAFKVEKLSANLFRSEGKGENLLGALSLEFFTLLFSMTRFTMQADISLRSLTMLLEQAGKKPIQFLSSVDSNLEEHPNEDLLRLTYRRAQPQSPEFLTTYEGIDQAADIQISTIILRAAPEPLLFFYDFIMATFVPRSQLPTSESQQEVTSSQVSLIDQQPSGSKIKILIKMARIRVILLRDVDKLATLMLSTADISLLLRPKTMRLTGRLGGFVLTNDAYPTKEEFRDILSIEGPDLADFTYQTYDPSDETYAGFQSSITLNAASLKLHFLEKPLQAIYLFFLQFARLKGIYDAATQVAAQNAPQISQTQFNISIKSPIISFPVDPVKCPDTFILRLGEITAKNDLQPFTSTVEASLRGIQLASHFLHERSVSTLKIVDDINVEAKVKQRSPQGNNTMEPTIQVAINITDVRVAMTQLQYQLLLAITQSVPFIFSVSPTESPGEATIMRRATLQESTTSSPITLVNLEPELTLESQGHSNRSNLELLVAIHTINLRLFDGAATDQNLAEHGIIRFELMDNALRLKTLFNGAMEAQLVMRSFTVTNLRPGKSKFKEIIPAVTHDRNQFMLLYSTSGNVPRTGMAILTVDSPQIILALDPLVALIDFFMVPQQSKSTENVPLSPTSASQPPAKLDFRIDLHDVSITILHDDASTDTQAIRLYLNQLMISQQGITALTMNHLGMSLLRMGVSAESLRFLDEVDLTFSLDQRSNISQKFTSIEVQVKPIVFRASYRDVNLITSIINKALELYSDAQHRSVKTTEQAQLLYSSQVTSTVPNQKALRETVGNARVLLSREQFKGSFEGFQLVLIGDMHEQPLFHLKVKPFIIGAKDWSNELSAQSTLALQMSYWNMSNSHWEPLIDPWTITISVSRTLIDGMKIVLEARERLDLNISTTFVELASVNLHILGSEAQVLQKARGTYAPYRIRNYTGLPITIWKDWSDVREGECTISHGQSLDWRFDDWKTLREHIATSIQHNVGVQFIGRNWESLRGITVDREGEYVFTLRPRNDKYPDRLLCEVKVVDMVKVVTLRSTYKIENNTLYTLEVMLVDGAGKPIDSAQKVYPGQDYSLPIEAVSQGRVRLQPDQGFGYKWCTPIRREDLFSKKSFSVKCPHTDPKEASFRFQAYVQLDENGDKRYSKVNLKLRAPLELENLLPYNIEYRIYDKDTDQNWRSFLRKGGTMPVHSIELDHFVLLSITVQETVFKPSEFAIINTDGQGEFDIESQLVLLDEVNRKLNLKLHYLRYPEAGGAFRVQLYSPFVVFNKTGLPFSVKATKSARSGWQEAAGDTRLSVISSPTPFLLSHQQTNGLEFMFRLDESQWSKAISMEAVSAESALIIPNAQNKGEEVHVGLSWAEGSGKYKLSKVITLAPRFILISKLSTAISFREHGAAPRERYKLEPNEWCPLHLFRIGQNRLLTFANPGVNAVWSSPINVENLGAMHLRLPLPSESLPQLIKATIKIDAATIFVYLEPAENDWPFVIENDSDCSLEYGQVDDGEDKRPNSKPNPLYRLQPHTKDYYAWDFPASQDKKIALIVKGSRRVIDVMEIGSLPPFRFQDNQRVRTLSLDVRAEGVKQALRITNYNSERSAYRPRERSYSGTSTRQDTASTFGSVEAFEAISQDVPTTLTFSLRLAGIGISLINRKIVEVLYTTAKDTKLDYSDSPISRSVNFSCGTLQVDNQLHEAIYPVLVQPTPISKEASRVAALPTIQASMSWLKDQAHGVFFVKYCSVLLQALTIEADEDLLFAVYDLAQVKGLSWEVAEETDYLIQYPVKIPEPKDTSIGQTLYFELFELQPIVLSLSFMRTDRVSAGDPLSLRNPLSVAINALTMTIGNVNDAPLELNALAIKDMRLTMPELQSRIIYHYRQDVIRQLYRILGSADFIGNPVGLFTNVSSGVADIFYEPYNGVVMHGNRELGIGFAKGAASFLKKTVFGISDSMTKFTSSVGKGLSAATFDAEYQARRRMNQRRNRPRHAIYGVTAGGEALASSVTSAVEGVLMKPLEGAEAGGALGFFKGVGKGLVGVVTKPVVGVFDLASNVSEGIRNTTTVFDNSERERARLPRHVASDGVLRPYSPRDALGQYWMKDLNGGVYRSEFYVAHISSPGGDNVILLTASRIISFWSKKLRLDWDLPLTQIKGITAEDTGIRLAHKAGQDQDKFALIPEKETQFWFFGQIAAVVKSFNSKRRMEA